MKILKSADKITTKNTLQYNNTKLYELFNGSIYQGEWKDGLRSGTGRIIYKSGSFYEGNWNNDQVCGNGKYIDRNLNSKNDFKKTK